MVGAGLVFGVIASFATPQQRAGGSPQGAAQDGAQTEDGAAWLEA